MAQPGRRRASLGVATSIRLRPPSPLSALLGVEHRELVDEAARRANASDSVRSRWLDLLEPVVAMRDVLLHGDLCENQLLVDDRSQVHTVIDWDTAGMGHPLHDFDFGEWGFGIYAWESHFGYLRAGMWTAYATARDAEDLPSADAVNLAFALSEFTYFARHRDRGQLDAWRAHRLANTEVALPRFT